MCELSEFNQFRIEALDCGKERDFFELINTNRDRLKAYFAGTVAYTSSLESTIKYCKVLEQKIKDKSYFPFVIVNTNTDKLIGFIDFKNIDWTIPKAEIGYFVDYEYEGRGIITNALSQLIRYINKIHSFRKLLCRVNSDNSGSIKVAVNNGFEFEGTIRYDYKKTSGELVDLDYYGKIFHEC